MTALEQVYRKIQTFPEWKIEAVLAYVQVLEPEDGEKSIDRDKEDFERLQTLRKTVGKRVPKGFDARKEYEAALEEKYGNFA